MDVRALATAMSLLSIAGLSCGQAAEAPKAAREAAAALIRAKMVEGNAGELIAQPVTTVEAPSRKLVRLSAVVRQQPRVSEGLPVPKDAIAHRVAVAFATIVPGEAATTAVSDRSSPANAAMSLAYVDVNATTDEPTPATNAIEALIIRHAQANQVPTRLAQALIKVESGYRPRATGRHGEIGLMQISPRTARGIGYAGSPRALYDPETNLTWGMKYLAKAQELAGGDVCGTLLRYNAGLDATRRSQSSSKFCARVKAKMAERA